MYSHVISPVRFLSHLPSRVSPRVRAQAVSTGLIAAFQLREDVWVFGKHETGRVDPWRALIIFPYYWSYRLIVWLHRIVYRFEPVATYITPGYILAGWIDDVVHVYDARAAYHSAGPSSSSSSSSPREMVGGKEDGEEREEGKTAHHRGPVAILDLTCELPRRVFNPALVPAYLCIPTFDRSAPRPADIQRAVEFARAQRRQGHDVVVHCAFGHGRSSITLLACLMAEGIVGSFAEGEAMLRKVRPLVSMSDVQKHLLEAWRVRYLPSPIASHGAPRSAFVAR